MMSSATHQQQGNYHPCWLSEPPEDSWLRSYLKKIALPSQPHIIKQTLINEAETLTRTKINLVAVEKASLIFLLAEDRFSSSEAWQINCQPQAITLSAGGWPGLLYGWFYLLTQARLDRLPDWQETQQPALPLRLINHWDNLDGSIERGYAGQSLFFQQQRIAYDQPRLRQYARLLASIGINGIAINNVNVHQAETRLIDDDTLPAVAEIATLLRAYGIRLFLSVNFAAPLESGAVDSADPLDPLVVRWWRDRARHIYQHIPDFGGYVVKADSEHRPGPFTYQRSHAEGANMLAETLAEFGGVVFWRCFVYNCQQAWYDRSTDRAKAAFDHFAPLDGQFRDNVILQIKNGPMDFQVREPVSPLLGAMPHTSKVMELQITQEYTGQQIDLCWLVPQWQSILNFDTTPGEPAGTLRDILAGGSPQRMAHSGITAVVNTGDSFFWTGHPLAQANLYGYGRLLWDTRLDARQLAQEWCRLTLSSAPRVVKNVSQMLLDSWQVYESYTAPLGVGWMVQPHHHYGPAVDGYEYDSWGTYHYADRNGVGVDRTLESGTGYVAQYHPAVCRVYNLLQHCPQELLLFFHHVPYRYPLPSGVSLIQHIYDAHFAGVAMVEQFIRRWQSLSEDIDPALFREVEKRLDKQLKNAQAWRDQINTYFYRKSGIKDAHNRLIYP